MKTINGILNSSWLFSWLNSWLKCIDIYWYVKLIDNKVYCVCVYFPTNSNDILTFILLVSHAVSHNGYICSLMTSGRSKPRWEAGVISQACEPVCAALKSNQSVAPACGNHPPRLQVLPEGRELLFKLQQNELNIKVKILFIVKF